MLLTVLIPVLMVLVGVLMYALSANPKINEIGRGMFWAGFFALAFFFSGRRVSL